MNKYVNSEKGVGSLMAVISLTLLMVIVGGIATMTIANSHENKNNKDNMQIQYAAEAGLKKALVSFYNYNNNSNTFDWLPNDDTLNDNGVVDEDVKTNLHKYKEGNAKASYAVYICRKVSENPDKFIKVNDELKNTGPVNGTSYYITVYGFINSGNDKKKVASAVIKYGESGGDVGGLDTKDGKGKIALYSNALYPNTVKDQGIHISDPFTLDETVYSAIASPGNIGRSGVMENKKPNQIEYGRDIPIDFDYSKLTLLNFKSEKFGSQYFRDNFTSKYFDELEQNLKEKEQKKDNEFNEMNKSGKVISVNAISTDDDLPDSTAIECNTMGSWYPISEINVEGKYIKVKNGISGGSDVNITDSKVIVNGEINLGNGYHNRCTFKNSIIKAKKITGGKDFIIENCLIEVDDIDNLYGNNRQMDIKNSIINIKNNFTPAETIININGSELNANYILFKGSTIKKSIIHSNTSIDNHHKIILGDEKDETSGVILCAEKNINANEGIESYGSYIQAKGNFTVNNDFDLNSSIINVSGSIHSTDGVLNLFKTLILAKNQITFNSTNNKGEVTRVNESFVKSFEEGITFTDAVKLNGVILSQKLITISSDNGIDIKYNDNSFNESLKQYLNSIIDTAEGDKNILSTFKNLLGIPEGEEENVSLPQYGNVDYAKDAKINND